MPVRLQAMGLVGLAAQPVSVEVDLANGLPSFTIVGLPDKAVEEARERVRAAIKNAGFEFPSHRITVNLAPADLPKAGPIFDLPIALGILTASGVIPHDRVRDSVSVGELSLSGEVRPVDGILPMMLNLRSSQPKQVIVPEDNVAEAQLVGSLPVIGAHDLRQLVDGLVQGNLTTAARENDATETPSEEQQRPDLAFISGLEQVKRVLEIAASGGHNVLLIGPPGTGKTLLARAFASILPDLTPEEHLEVLTIRSAAGLLRRQEVGSRLRPVRTPHHTASPAAVVGGGSKLKPGEVSLAHRGVLFLDELPEFPRAVLEALREPLEDGRITIARARGAMTFPAQFILLAAANPCPCGFSGDPAIACQCSPADLARYQRRLSGPLLDRIDIMVTVPRQTAEVLLDQPIGTTSAEVRERVSDAREQQFARHARFGQKLNSQLSPQELKQAIVLTPAARQVLLEAGDHFHLSGRSLHRLLKVSRTIADLKQEHDVDRTHVAEALQYRQHFAAQV